jgi:hypothetical protein
VTQSSITFRYYPAACVLSVGFKCFSSTRTLNIWNLTVPEGLLGSMFWTIQLVFEMQICFRAHNRCLLDPF